MLARSTHDSVFELKNIFNHPPEQPVRLITIHPKAPNDDDPMDVVVFHWDSEESKKAIFLEEIKRIPEKKSAEGESLPEPPGCFAKFCRGLKKITVGTVALATAIPAGIYGLMFASGEAPDKIGEAWWFAMSVGERFFSVFNALIALIINTIANLKYIPEAFIYLKKNFQSCCKTPLNFLCGKTALILAIAASLAAAALGYESFIWLSDIVSILVSTSNFLAYGARRYASISSLIERIRNFFDRDVQFQQACINQLKLLKTEYFSELKHSLEGKTLNEDTVRDFLKQVYDEAVRMDLENADKPQEIFHPVKKSDQAKEYLGLAFDIGLGAVCAYFFFPVYAQKGFDGMKIIWKYAGDPSVLDQVSHAGKIAISFAPGMASSLLGFAAGYDIRKTFLTLANKDKTKTFTVLAGSAIACTAQASIAKAVCDAPNLFGVVSNNSHGKSLIFFNGYASGCFLFNGIAKLALNESVSVAKPTVSDTIRWLEKNKLSKTAVSMLRNHGFFNKEIETGANLPLTEAKHSKKCAQRNSIL